MKRIRTLIAIIAVSLTAASCAVTKYNSGIPAMEVTPIALLQPLSYIEFMLKDHSMAISDSLSQISSSTLAEIVSNRIPVDCIIPVEYTEEMMAEVDVLPGLDPKTLFGATIPDKTRQLILDSGHRYGAKCYIQEELFKEADLTLTWMDYSGYRPYPQLFGDFVHNVSILDLLFNTGPEALSYIRNRE